MRTTLKNFVFALAASGVVAIGAPAAAADFNAPRHATAAAPADYSWNDRDRGRWDRDNRWDRRNYNRRYDERVGRNTRVWRGDDGRNYCRKSDGTTGLIIGAAGGALLGREIDGGRERTLGTILGGAAGALLGKEIDSGTVCR